MLGDSCTNPRFADTLVAMFHTLPEMNVAALGGYLEGLSFLNKNPRKNFAEAFTLKAREVSDVIPELQSIFSHLDNLTLKFDENFNGGFRQLGHNIETYLLVAPHVADEPLAQDMRSYLSFKVMDRLNVITDFDKKSEPKRIVGNSDDGAGEKIFYIIKTSDICFALYFHRSLTNAEI